MDDMMSAGKSGVESQREGGSGKDWAAKGKTGRTEAAEVGSRILPGVFAPGFLQDSIFVLGRTGTGSVPCHWRKRVSVKPVANLSQTEGNGAL
jgi:hypothetical protein